MLSVDTVPALLTAAAVLLAAGSLGAMLALRLGSTRLVGALIAGILIGPTVLGRAAPQLHRQLLAGAVDESHQLEQARRDAAQAIAAAQSTGVSHDYIDRLRTLSAQRLADLALARDKALVQRRLLTFMSLGLPAVLVALYITGARMLAQTRPTHVLLASAVLTSALAAAIVGGLYVRFAPDLAPNRVWGIAFVLACAMPTLPRPRPVKGVDDQPLWCFVFLPLLGALAGSQVDLIGPMNGLLVLVTLIVFCDAKTLGPIVLMRRGRLTWNATLTSAARMVIGHPLALALALTFYNLDLINAPTFTALVIANGASLLLLPPVLRLIDRAASA